MHWKPFLGLRYRSLKGTGIPTPRRPYSFSKVYIVGIWNHCMYSIILIIYDIAAGILQRKKCFFVCGLFAKLTLCRSNSCDDFERNYLKNTVKLYSILCTWSRRSLSCTCIPNWLASQSYFTFYKVINCGK
jgi:hypothetical protein